jgi:hypothetical protein
MQWNRTIAIVDRASHIINIDPIEGANARHFIVLNEFIPWQRSYLMEVNESETKVIGCYKNRKSAKNAAQEHVKKINPDAAPPKKKARIKK